MADRTYTEREVSDLISRAVERQQDASRQESAVGLTLDEVERIGQETDIDPEHLRAAAAEMDSAGRTLSRQSTTSDKHIAVERWIDAPLTPEGWEDAVAHLRTEFGLSMAAGMSAGGTVQQVGNAYEWQHTSGVGVQTTVTASPRDGRTRLQLRQLVGWASPRVEGIGYGLIVAMAAAAIGGPVSVAFLDVDPGVAALVFVLVWAVAAPAITALDRRWRAGKLRQLDALADDLGDVLTVPVGTTPEPARDADPARIDARLLDDDAPETGDVSPVRRVRP